MFADGQGVPQDFKQAVFWWGKAARAGDANAYLVDIARENRRIEG
jgi:TPR repeat protein